MTVEYINLIGKVDFGMDTTVNDKVKTCTHSKNKSGIENKLWAGTNVRKRRS